ncbi:MAG: hypothetical protein KC731_42435, partial [Myxococcales bacterium]|nr:hypothetical protein [Myxococcales bacterium]
MSDTIDNRRGEPIARTDVRARVSVQAPGVILIRELPESTGAIYGAMVERARELGEEFGNYATVVDLAEATVRPDRDMMDILMRTTKSMGCHWAIVEAKSMMMRVVLQFVGGRLGVMPHVSFHASLEEAVAAASEAVEQAGGATRSQSVSKGGEL